MKKISVVIPCYNEEGNIEKMYITVSKQMEQFKKYDYEILFIDNDSIDDSQTILKNIADTDKHVKVIFNMRNFGPERSGVHAFLQATGDAIIGLACDFQDPPELIPLFVEAWEKGAKVVWGKKSNSQEGTWMWRLRSTYYWIIKRFSPVKQYAHVTGFGLYDRSVVRLIQSTQELSPLFRNLIPELGYEPVFIEYEQPARRAGKSSYNFMRYFDTAIFSLINTSRVPLHIATLIGAITAGISFLLGTGYLLLKLFFWSYFPMGMAPVLIGMFFLGSIQIMLIGLLGEYIGEVLTRVTHRPRVVEKERLNFDDEE